MQFLQFKASNIRWALLVILISSLKVDGRPPSSSGKSIDGVAALDPTKVVCVGETTSLCQQCAKKSKSAVVYPWCCANHEGAREWCEHYLNFGLP